MLKNKCNIHLIHHVLEESANVYPDKDAVAHGSETYTYIQVEEMSNKVANALLDCGIQKGDRCAVLLRNSISYIISYYGLLKAGAIAVPLNTGMDGEEINTMLVDCTPEILITEAFFSEILNGIFKNKSSFTHLLLTDNANNLVTGDIRNILYLNQILNECSANKPSEKVVENDLASIIYTSGSTGKPKGVVLSHHNIVSNTKSIVSYLHLNKEDRIMVILPFYYVYGKSLLNTHFCVSGTVVIDNRFVYPNVILKNMVEKEVTGFAGVPSTFSILLNKSNIRKIKLPRLRYLTQAGGHMPKSIKEELLETFPDKDLYIMYGATEASARLSYLEPERIREKIGSIGKAIPGVELKIVKEDGSEAKVGEEGEIIAKGSNIMLGYWNATEESKKVLKDGWYYTGDLATYDEEGYLHITGRKKDMIKVGKHKVSAKEVEEVLYQHNGVHEVAIVGVQDNILGEALVAYIVPNCDSGIKDEDVISFCESFLPEYKIPNKIIFLNELPKNESGKILKQKLIKLYIETMSQT